MNKLPSDQKKSVKPRQERPLAPQRGQQVMPTATNSKALRSNVVAPQAPMTSAASLAAQDTAKNKGKLTPQAVAQAQRQATPVRTPPSTVRSNLAQPQTPVTSASSLSPQNAAKARSEREQHDPNSVANIQRQLYPLASSDVMKRLTT